MGLQLLKTLSMLKKKEKKSFVSKQRYGLMLSINLGMIWVSHCDL